MFRSKPKPISKRVWRISTSAPMGEWVEVVLAPQIDPVAATSDATRSFAADEDGHWLMSSFDLLSGAEVTEDPDTMPGDLFEELFAPKAPVAKGPGP